MHIISVKRKMPAIQKCRQQNSNITSDIEKFLRQDASKTKRCQQNIHTPVITKKHQQKGGMPAKT
jgi:hypothetical protein